MNRQPLIGEKQLTMFFSSLCHHLLWPWTPCRLSPFTLPISDTLPSHQVCFSRPSEEELSLSHNGSTKTETPNIVFSATECSLPHWEENSTHYWVDLMEGAGGFL